MAYGTAAGNAATGEAHIRPPNRINDTHSRNQSGHPLDVPTEKKLRRVPSRSVNPRPPEKHERLLDAFARSRRCSAGRTDSVSGPREPGAFPAGRRRRARFEVPRAAGTGFAARVLHSRKKLLYYAPLPRKINQTRPQWPLGVGTRHWQHVAEITDTWLARRAQLLAKASYCRREAWQPSQMQWRYPYRS